MAISGPLTQVLRSARPQLNEKVAQAQRRFSSFDPNAFAAFIERNVDPLVSAVAATNSERSAGVALAAFDLALQIVAQGLGSAGRIRPVMDGVWQQVLPACARLVGDHQLELIGPLCNAAIFLGSSDYARPEQWIREMAALARRAESLTQLQALGQLAAWRAGLAQFRSGAIAAADTLPAPLALAAIGATGETPWAQVREHLLADRWWRVAPSPVPTRPRIEIGSFTGFGGVFPVPPVVRSCADGFLVRSGEHYFFLTADVFGAALLPATGEQFDQALAAGATRAEQDRITQRMKASTRDLDLPPGHVPVACTADTVAIASPFSHAVTLVPAC
jgi:hypothetical protein